ncbi:MAG: energy transducer TonB [Bacteroidetes bacterium]|nr:energy transducer TonB [Bacteroidota bacterium]
MTRCVLALLFVLLLAVQAHAQSEEDNNDLVIDATFVSCSDTTESLLILRDGRAIYALGNHGAAFSVSDLLLADLKKMIDTVKSSTSSKNMDSCATLGLIVEGPKFLLINRTKPSPGTRALYTEIERQRKIGERRMNGTIERFAEKAREEPDSTIETPASVEPVEIRKRVRLSPVAREWRCTGTVYAAVLITNKGKVLQAFVQKVQSRGKCASVLTTAALRAVLLATYQPATNHKGRPMNSWIQVEVPFTRARHNP